MLEEITQPISGDKRRDLPTRLRVIALRAATFDERRRCLPRAGLGIPSDKATARLEKWQQAVGKDDPSRLRLRLANIGLTPDDLLPLLDDVALPVDAPLPDWTAIVADFVDEAERYDLTYLQRGRPNSHPAVDPAEPIPFEDLLVPLLAVARRRLEGALDPAIPRPRLPDLERQLLQTVQQIAGPTLLHCFWLARVRANPVLALLGLTPRPDEEDDLPTDLYHQFVEETMSPEGLWALFGEYSVLARLLAEAVARWVAVSAEFYRRLAADRPLLETRFGRRLPTVAAIKAGLSDPHHGGRSVLQLTFADDFRIIYKPHSLAVEAAYQELVVWINERSDLPPLATLDVVERGDHGWVGFVPHLPCETEEEVTRYFTRIGMLIGLMYILRGTDYHMENLIASGEHPVPIDLEMICSPPIAASLADETETPQRRREDHLNTVLFSGMLPFGNPRLHGGVDVSYLGAGAKPLVIPDARRLRRINSDYMGWGNVDFRVDPAEQTHLLYRQGHLQTPSAHRETILAGFAAMYRTLMAHRAELLAANGPLTRLQNLEIRFIFRPTRVYFRILLTSLEADLMREGIDRHIHLEHLGRGHTQDDRSMRHFSGLLEEEIRALTLTDIPFFKMAIGQRHLTTPAGLTIEGAFTQSGYDQVRDLLNSLEEADLRRQLALMRQTLTVKALDLDLTTPPWTNGPSLSPAHLLPAVRLSPHDWLTEAERIAERLMAVATRDRATAAWIAAEIDVEVKGAYSDWVGDDLYNGRSGIALFFAALGSVTGQARYREAAYAALGELRQRLARGERAHFLRMGIGGATGIGSILYALTHCARLLQDDGLLADATHLAALLSSEVIEGDERLDIIGGAAGAILGLLTVYRDTGDDALLDAAVACGRRLLATQRGAPTGGAAWPTIDGALQTGFSHGAAGIGYALLRLYESTGEDAFLSAAREGITFERNLFSPEEGNWPDLRSGRSYTVAWCHGAPGIALARHAGQAIWPESAAVEEIARGIEITRRTAAAADMDGLAHLCCGHWGRVEILRTVGGSEEQATALALAASLVRTASERGGYHLLDNLPCWIIQPGFFQGLAGIGYSCLRLAREAQADLPLVLLWE